MLQTGRTSSTRLSGEGFEAPPDHLSVAVRSDLDNETYQYEREAFYSDETAEVPLPFYGFDDYTAVTRHGFNTGGNHARHVRASAPGAFALRSRENQFPHDYSCPQAIRTKVPEEHYSTSYIADRTCEFLKRDAAIKAVLPDGVLSGPAPPVPPGRYWDMYQPHDMPVPDAYDAPDWDAPAVKIAERNRAEDPSAWPEVGLLGGGLGTRGAGSAGADLRDDRDD